MALIEFLPSFGRRQGRKLKTSRSALIETLLPRLKIDLPETGLNIASVFTDAAKPLWVEIGFGAGEHLVEQARQNPEINFIGCEPYINGMARLLASIEENKLSNIRLYDGDGRQLLAQLNNNTIERLFILFPDPWPKVRHHKRRIITQESLALIYNKLIDGGQLRIATDHVDYCGWILAQLLAFKKLVWTAEKPADWTNPPPGWIKTRYQCKAEAQGRSASFLTWKKLAVTIA